MPAISFFVVSADAFPTEVRAGCQGLTAAAGKLGAVAGTFGAPILLDSVGVKVFFLKQESA